jgi:hypothetical protein
MQKPFLLGRSKYLPVSPLVDMIVSCKSRELVDSHYNLVTCWQQHIWKVHQGIVTCSIFCVMYTALSWGCMMLKICVCWTQLWRLCDQESMLWGSYESNSSHLLRNINENYVLRDFWKFLKTSFFMLFSILVQNMSKILTVHFPITCLYHERSDYFQAHMVQLSIDFCHCTSCFWYQILLFGREF